ncbi:tellurite resistance TerB family protein [Curvivirga aplysinae]|uniref:tellurite resistance TerB family protein n=1 Tax=Curvivirga aplysinae TaxID=2529852 RepID=UPI0012BCF377|nr:TerB family tellurite resistance protein [Curvivirga aplysinae]MTI10611.1 TerB family tellurite resistance protein [Curvivirga aplysinae]
MWANVKKFIFESFGETEEKAHTERELQIAAAALLVEAALLDGEFDDYERAIIVSDCMKSFDMDAETAHSLLDEAVALQKDAVDIHSFISKFAPNFDYQERLQLLEMLWGVVYADGVLHDYEANLMRRVCGLLGVKDKDSGDLRKQVLARMDIVAA